MKKIIVAVLILANLLFMFGCGSKPSANNGSEKTDGENIELTMWTFPFASDDKANEERANYDAMKKEFESQNKGITLNIEIIPWANRETKMLTAIAAGKGPDIMYLNPDILKLFVAYGVLAPIDDYITSDELSSYSDTLLDNSVRLDGSLYGLPVLVDLGTPVYNLDLLKEIGMTEDTLPTTWDEYDKMLAALKEKDIYGVYYNYCANGVISGAYAQMFSEGCDVISSDGKVDVDSEAGLKVLNRLKSWYQNGYTPKDSLSVQDDDSAFLSGKVASVFSPKDAGFFVRTAPDITFNWAAGPILKGAAGQYGMSTVGSLGVSNNCKNVEAAAKFIKFFTEDERNEAWCEYGGYICPKKGTENPYKDLKGYSYILQHLDCTRGEPNHAASRTMSTVFIPDLQKIVSGDVEFNEGVTKLKTDMEGIVKTIEALKN